MIKIKIISAIMILVDILIVLLINSFFKIKL